MSAKSEIMNVPAGKKSKIAEDAAETRISPRPVSKNPKGIGLALGGGAARGWSHIGVLRALDEAHIPIKMIAGTSIGALVGGCYLAGKLDELEEFARSITRTNILRYIDFAFRASGLISGDRLADKMDAEIGDLNIEDLDRRFVAIATDIQSGSEIWLEHGSLSQAIRASYALPGVFEPVLYMGKQLVDGALVNPVPVSACRAYEQSFVLAINLSGQTFRSAAVIRSHSLEPAKSSSQEVAKDEDDGSQWFSLGKSEGTPAIPKKSRLGITGVMIESFNIIQDKITRSRLAGDPPDFTIRPKLNDIGLADFHKASETIDLGYEYAKEKIDELEDYGLRDAIG